MRGTLQKYNNPVVETGALCPKLALIGEERGEDDRGISDSIRFPFRSSHIVCICWVRDVIHIQIQHGCLVKKKKSEERYGKIMSVDEYCHGDMIGNPLGYE